MTSFIVAQSLDLNKLRGQGYNRVGNMSGKQMEQQQSYLQIIFLPYIFTVPLTLNLAVVKSLDVQCVRNMIGVVNKVTTFSLLI